MLTALIRRMLRRRPFHYREEARSWCLERELRRARGLAGGWRRDT